MTNNPLIAADQLNQHLNNPSWVIVDCRFNLANPDAGFTAYRHGHIPNASYAHLNNDLSSPVTAMTGRHPLPHVNQLAKKLGEWGISTTSHVVVYDDVSGAFAGRLWWLLRQLGHQNVAVLDGGYKHWQQLGLPITTALPTNKPTIFRPYCNEAPGLTAMQVENALAQKSICLIDARTQERFHGQHEPIDPVAGHISGAANRPFQNNLDGSGFFHQPERLKAEFSSLIAGKSPEQVVHMCGSGVTACHNLLAMEIAGLRGSKLYPGSWSEWITNPNHSVVTQ
jgi:thiosulfate/3-mercaptopyruvate sulfurtransferase